jgi:hypothetical protein
MRIHATAAIGLTCACLLGNALLQAAFSYPAPPPWQPNPDQREHLRRSLALLATSTPADRKTVRVLFYGQSITQQAWWKEVEHYLRATYTNANLIVENRAIGGHASQLLVKTAEADLYPFQPDELWKAYLKAHTLKAADLLRDGVHLNAQGEWLMAELLKTYLAPLPPKAAYDPLNEPRVRTVALQPSAGQESLRLEFTGTRADLIFKPKSKAKETISVLVDGKPPSAIPELYGFTRVSAFPMTDWPVLLRVEAASPLVVEDWSLKIDRASPDGKLCHFSVRGSATGEDGEGFSTNRFVSRSGRVVVEPADWNVAYSVAVFKRPVPENYTATWRATLRGADTVEPPAATPGTEACVTVAQGLPPGRHVLELRGAYLAEQIQAARFYCPSGNPGRAAGSQ